MSVERGRIREEGLESEAKDAEGGPKDEGFIFESKTFLMSRMPTP